MLEKRIETVKANAGITKVRNAKTINSFKRKYNITSSIRQEELVVLSRFVAPPHVLVLIFGKMLRRFFATTC